MINSMNEKEENIVTLNEIYNNIKNHPYVNEITIYNGLTFHDEFSKIYFYIYDWEADELDELRDKYKDPWNKDNKHFIIPGLALLSIEGHDINMMYAALKGKGKDEDGCELNKIHHIYMMEILEVLRSIVEGTTKEYINIWKNVRTKDGWKWRTFLYKAEKQIAHVYKDGHCDYSYVGINCIRESKLESFIKRYSEIIKYYKEKGDNNYANLYQTELDDLINKTNKYHICISDEEYIKYKREV